MSKSVCLYFQVHQPFRLRRDYGFFQIGPDHAYEDHDSNKAIMERIANECYLPANKIIQKLINKYKGRFKVSYSISGMALEQFKLYAPQVIDSFKKLVETGYVEILGETYYHSLACLKSVEEVKEQVHLHSKAMQDTFGVKPTTFRNTELIYNNDVSTLAREMGFKTVLCEGAEQILQWRSPNHVYTPINNEDVRLLLKNYKLSDDVAFRFSNKDWSDYPLTSKKYSRWIKDGGGDVVNLFMDYETFGEHQKKKTGIFKFLEKFPKQILKDKNFSFKTPAEVGMTYFSADTLDCPEYCSWADEKRDLSAWIGNSLQDSAIEYAYSLEHKVKEIGDQELLHTWRKLLSSDHYYYACTKWKDDGDVHTYFSPFESPHDAYVIYSNVLNDFNLTLLKRSSTC